MKRWDFETEEEYSSYQSGREAMPKLVHHTTHTLILCTVQYIVYACMYMYM